MVEKSTDRMAVQGGQSVIACVIAVCAGGATRWLGHEPLVVLAVIAIAAGVLVLGTPRARIFVVIAGALLAAVAVQLPAMQVEALFRGTLYGLLTSLALAGPVLIRRAVRQQREFRRRGWELAEIESRRRASDTRAAVQRERMTLAAEMHDGLGHALTLIAVRLGQLSLAPSLTDKDRAEVASIREIAADSADDLGLAVRLLRESDTAAAGWAVPTIEDTIEGARQAGMHVEAHLDDRLTARASEETANATARVVQEGLTNAAKHAPGQPVSVRVEVHDDVVVAQVSNPSPERESDASVPGFGLAGLRHRAEMLGGQLRIDSTDSSYSIRLSIPLRARPTVHGATDDVDIVRAESQADTVRSRATRAAVALPVALVCALAFVGIGYFILANVLPVISQEQFSSIRTGDDRASIEQVLPPMDMLEAPREEFQAQPEEQCRYFESSISFFERVDVYVVCFIADHVSRTGTVAAP